MLQDFIDCARALKGKQISAFMWKVGEASIAIFGAQLLILVFLRVLILENSIFFGRNKLVLN